MSAEILRRAADLMRTRAKSCAGVFGGEFTVTESTSGPEHPWPFTLRNGAQVLADRLDRSDAEHIASWPPAVALAVADWLEKVAEDFDENTIVDRPDVGEYAPPAPDATWCDYCGGAIASPHYSAVDQRCDCYRWPTALAVARAYLGDER